jgi:hypothetical protein
VERRAEEQVREERREKGCDSCVKTLCCAASKQKGSGGDERNEVREEKDNGESGR